ncbi:MAG TPA: hypothetical protein VF766_04365, partial [Pyrinomonadaceae bacterium]
KSGAAANYATFALSTRLASTSLSCYVKYLSSMKHEDKRLVQYCLAMAKPGRDYSCSAQKERSTKSHETARIKSKPFRAISCGFVDGTPLFWRN